MTDNTASNKLIAKNTIFLYVRMAVVMLVTLYTSRVILQILGVESFGVYNVVAGFVSMFAFLNTSLTACIQRYYNYEQGREGSDGFRKVYVTSFYIQLFLSILVLVLVETIGLWYLNNKLVIPADKMFSANVLFQASALSMVLVIMQVPYSAAVMAKERMDYYAFVGIADVVLKLLIVFALPLFPYEQLSTYGVLLFAVSLIDFLLYFVYSRRKFEEIRLSQSFNKALFKSMLAFSGWSMLGSFAQIVRNQGLNIILNLFFGPIVNAARGISYQVRTAVSSFMANIPTAARPQLTEAYARGDYERSKQIFFSISKICFLLIYTIALPVAYEMEYLLHLWLGNNVPEYTTIFSQIIVVIAIVEAFNWPVSMIIYASGKIGVYNIVTSLIGLLVLPLCYFALEFKADPVVVYMISLFISISVQVASLICMQVIVKVRILDYCKSVLLPSALVCLCSVFVPLLVISLMKTGMVRLIVNCAISMSLACALSYFIGLNRQEKTLVRGFIAR
ncbi:MAG: oligosaccharide flippase family protein [Bacteroidales bacterium]|nr:oligosaccharide flippase family protein [Bacteroidales bacterium]